MIRVLIVVLDDRIGGIQNRILGITDSLRDKGIEIVAAVPNCGKREFSNRLNDKGIRTKRANIDSPKLPRSRLGVLKDIIWMAQFPIGVLQVLSIIRSFKADIVHVNGILGLHAIFAARIANVPAVWHLISTIYPQKIPRLIRWLFMNDTDKLVFVNSGAIDYYLGSHSEDHDAVVIHEPVDVDMFSIGEVKRESTSALRRKLNIGEDQMIVGFVGNLTPQKDLELFVDVASIVVERMPGAVRFIIIGGHVEGHEDYAKRVKARISAKNKQDSILLVGKVDDIRLYESLIDVLLITSRAEGTPIVILEAMSLSKPVVSVNVGGISEQVLNGISGYISNGRIAAELAELTIRLLEKTDIREEMGAEGRRLVIRNFSLKGCVNRHVNVYHEALELRKDRV